MQSTGQLRPPAHGAISENTITCRAVIVGPRRKMGRVCQSFGSPRQSKVAGSSHSKLMDLQTLIAKVTEELEAGKEDVACENLFRYVCKIWQNDSGDCAFGSPWDAYAKILSALKDKRYTEKGTPEGWILQIVTTTKKGEFRREANRDRIESENSHEVLSKTYSQTPESPEIELQRKEKDARHHHFCKGLIGNLPSTKGRVMGLLMNGMSADEIARETGTSRDNVYQILHRTGNHYRKFFEPINGTDPPTLKGDVAERIEEVVIALCEQLAPDLQPGKRAMVFNHIRFRMEGGDQTNPYLDVKEWYDDLSYREQSIRDALNKFSATQAHRQRT